MDVRTRLQSPPLASQARSDGLVDNWLDGWALAATGIVDYFATALAKGPAALVLRWLELGISRHRPRWSSPHEVAFDAPIARLRDFSAA